MNRRPYSLCSRRLLLASASLLSIFAAEPVLAQVSTSLNPNSSPGGGTSVGGSQGVPQIPTLAPVAESALQRQMQIKTRAATAAEIARQAQIAARVAAVRDLSGPVRNGLGLGALNPAVTVRTSAAADPTGMLTWDGADLPTQVANARGGYDVTIKQDEERAILSWDTFNVGKDTSLTFDQKGNKDWIALNRVVGQLDPVTGRRDASKAPAPSQILGAVKADGGVIVINQNGIIFGGGAQVNTRALIATSLEVGPTARNSVSVNLRERNDKFLSLGLLGESDAYTQANPFNTALVSFAPQGASGGIAETRLEGGITIEIGAELTANDSGLILLAAPTIDNAGHLAATNGQIMLSASRNITLQRAEGSTASADPFVRGFNFINPSFAPDGFVRNRGTGLIESLRGNITLAGGAVVNEGVLWSTTSVSRNGSIYIDGADTLLAPVSTISIEPDTGGETIPQDPQSVLDFKPSVIRISKARRIEIGSGALVRAPGGNISIGAVAGADGDFNRPAITPDGFSRLFIDSGAVIDAGGIKDVLVPASRNQIQIFPVKKNELADSPDYRDSFLNGATVYIDPRISGVREDGVAWIGSPLIEAGSYYQQIGVKAEELLTGGGTVVIGGANWTGQGNQTLAADVIVKAGATIDVSGGWVRYEGGTVRTSQLITTDGRIVDISKADPNDAYVGFAGGFAVSHGRWGVTDYYQGAMFSGAHVSPEYIEGRDAGALTVKGSALAFDGTMLGHAYAGAMQRDQAKEGTAKSDIYGDLRVVQGAPSQLPSGAVLMVQMLISTSSGLFGGGDIAIVDAADADPLAADVSYDQHLSFDADGGVVRGTRGTTPLLDAARQGTLTLSDSLLSESGLSQVTLRTTGRVTVDADADVTLNPGGVFDVLAGHRIQIDGTVTAASGAITLETFTGTGSVFAPSVAVKGDYDVAVTGTLSTRGLWVNDFGRSPREQLGGAYLDGGSIAIYSAASVATAFAASPSNPAAPKSSVDLSGSIMIADGARIDVSSGGRVREDGSLELGARGGDLSLINETAYFQLSNSGQALNNIGSFPGFRINGGTQVAVNPDKINSVVSIADGTILAHGFAGGGTFNLTTPEIAFGNAPQGNATVPGLDFFSETGFGDYNIVSYKTALSPSQFINTLGGFDAILATQTLTVKASETLSLSQSMLPSVLSGDRMAALRGLASGGDVRTVLTPGIAADAWERRAVNLKLGGLTELVVEQGGRIEGEAGAELTVARLRNEGTIHLPGGTIHQELVLPLFYADDGSGVRIGVHSLDEVFGPLNANGKYSESAANALGYRAFIGGQTRILTNAEFARLRPLYLLGVMGEDAGIELAAGSVTDLSGISIVNPHATLTSRNGSTPIRSGIVYDGGSIESGPRQSVAGTFLRSQISGTYANVLPYITPVRDASEVRVEDGATLDLSGAVDVYDRVVNGGGMLDGRGFEKSLVWSDGGSLIAHGGLVLGAGAIIDARGGAPDAAALAAFGPAASTGGTIGMTDLILVEDGEEGARNGLSAAQFNASGFNTLAAWGSLTANGDIDFTLDSGKGRFFLYGRPFGSTIQSQVLTPDVIDQNYMPTISSDGGSLSIVADYVRFDSGVFGTIGNAARGTENTGSIAFKADMIDVSGALLIDRSVASASFQATGDIRLAGVQPWQNTLTPTAQVAPAIQGQIAVNGDLNFVAAQVYPTTGSNFLITSNAAEGTIRFARASSNTPATPYSAGGALTVLAASIEQDGVLRAPLGTITLGGATALIRNNSIFAPATTSVTLGDGSITSVSAAGLSIPYGTTTDGQEWYFAPGSNDPLSVMPAGAVSLGGKEVTVAAGATIDLSGGGDVTAYEFVPGNGGSYDVLDRLNVDAFSGNAGRQYPDGRQVYAIVPGLSNAAAAAYDPIYSADYADLYSLQGTGKQVWLDAAPGIAAGWYTLLPAKYATLPGGMRVVEMPGAANVAPKTSQRHADGTVIVSGAFGNGAGADSGRTLFSVMPRDTVLKHSNIQLASGNRYFADKAAHDGKITPRLAIDAGRLVLNPADFLNVDGTIKTAAAQGGRGANVDIGGKSIAILSELPADALADGTLRVTADSLTALNAASLLIGGTRTDNADGTTNLLLTAQTISIANDAAHPLSAPEIILAVDNLTTGAIASSITIADGSVIKATGTASPLSGNLIVNGAAPGSIMSGAGATVRVANGAERLVVRTRSGNPLAATLSVGEATLQGSSILVDSSGNTLIDRDAALIGDNLAIGAGQITFAHDAEGLTGFVVADGLLDTFANAKHLTLRSANSIDFVAGEYALGDLRLDTRGLKGLGGDVILTGGDIELSNSFGGGASCTIAGTLACGTGALDLISDSLVFGPGAVGVYGFGGGVKLTATGGLFTRGIGSFDAGAADVAIVTPFIGDRAESVAAGANPVLPNFSLATTGALAISKGAGAAPAAVEGLPGAALSLSGGSVSIAGTQIRATAGSVEIRSAGGVTLSDGGSIAAPGYIKAFGDQIDSTDRAAPGGRVRLVALNGDIDLGVGTTISVGAEKGNAGKLELVAGNGTILFGGTIDGKAPEGGAALAIDTRGAYDLAALGAAAGNWGFTRELDIRTRTGDLTLAAGQTLKAGTVKLTADGGLLTIAGTIDTSGINGGDVGLFGRSGVTLAATARVDATAMGYAVDDSRDAKGGDVIIGTDGTGAITLAAGSLIDVSAKRPGERLVRLQRDQGVYYQYAEGDQGGTVTLRAPIVEQAGADTVRVTVGDAGTIKGARAIALEAFKRWNLSEVAASGLYSGVVLNGATGAVTLDVRTGLDTTNADGTNTLVAGLNFLGDRGAGTVVEFVQDFDVSGAYGVLGGLSGQANFHARAGVDLYNAGDITLASNWNLGAGAIDVPAAIAAGLMQDIGGGQAVIVPGREAEAFRRFGSLTYRPGRSVTGEAPGVSLLAGGNLRLDGSLTDGFFQFAGLAAPATAIGVLTKGDGNAYPSIFPFEYYWIWDAAYNFGNGMFTYASGPVAYDASLNGAAPSSSGVQSMLPIPVAELTGLTPSSVSLLLSAGAAGAASVDPERVLAGRVANVLVAALAPADSGGGGGGGPLRYVPLFDASPWDFDDTTDRVGLDDFTARWEALNGVGERLIVTYGADDGMSMQRMIAEAERFAAALDDGSDAGLTALVDKYGRDSIEQSNPFGGDGQITAPAEVITYLWKNYWLDVFHEDVTEFLSNYGIEPNIVGAGAGGPVQNVVRTGTGSIRMKASGDVSLYDAAQPVPTYGAAEDRIGAAAIYTIGRQASLTPRSLLDPLTGAPVPVTAPSLVSDFAGAYYLRGGGDVSISAGRDVVSRRPAGERAFNHYLAGRVGNDTDLSIRLASFKQVTNSNLLTPLEDGAAAFGGGDVRIDAGRDLIDFTAVTAGSAVTAIGGNTLISFGGGNLDIGAGRDILGGRFEIWSGRASVTAGRDIGSAGIIDTQAAPFVFRRTIANQPILRMFDASFDVAAGRDMSLDTVKALSRLNTDFNGGTEQQNALGFYTRAAALTMTANGGIAIAQALLSIDFREGTVLPGTLRAAALTGDVSLNGTVGLAPSGVLLFPDADGQLELFAGGSIGAVNIAMLDVDPGVMPGYFSDFLVLDISSAATVGRAFEFPVLFPSSSDTLRASQHREEALHGDDAEPVRIYAGRDIGTADRGVTLWLPKQARIGAGRDILNMIYIGQNLADEDVTRITAGRDIIGTSRIVQPLWVCPTCTTTFGNDGVPRSAMLGNSFVIGGSGSFQMEAGRDAGPFLNSADVIQAQEPPGGAIPGNTRQVYGGGILSVGNEWNPWLGEQGADVTVMFGVANGVNYDGLRDYYLDPGNLGALDDDLFEQVRISTENVNGIVADRTKPIYAPILIAWLKANAATELQAATGSAEPSFEQAYGVFQSLPALRQRALLNQVYFNELKQPSIPDSPSYLQYGRGYSAVNLLFPADWGYTKNEQGGGSNGANESVLTGDLDLRLATIQTARGGDVAIFGPGGRVLGGSTVRTADQAARRAYIGGRLFSAAFSVTALNNFGNARTPYFSGITAIPAGYEGVLTLRGGTISTFTDGDFLLNQSRLFTLQGGDITMWSSNADLNAGQGPKTSSNFPAVVVRIDQNAFFEENRVASTTGAGIGAFRPTIDAPAPDVYLMAPRGTVDAGDAGVRVAGSIFVAALQVANADNFQVDGKSFGIPTGPTVDVGANLSASNSAASAAQEVAQTMQRNRRNDRPSIITVTIDGFGLGAEDCGSETSDNCPAR